MIHAPTIKGLIAKIALPLFPFYLIGLFFENVLLSVFVGAILILIWHFQQLNSLINWLWHTRDVYPPSSSGIWSDVFEAIYQRQLQNRKRRNELSVLVKRFRVGAESIPDAAVVFDDDKLIVWCNQLAQGMLGLKWPEDKGNRIDNFLRTPEFVAFLANKHYDQPFELISPVDDFSILECRVAPFEKDKWTLICRDITALKQLEQVRKDFVANVSHELKTPLTVMRGYLEMFGSDELPNPRVWKKAHSMMTEQTIRMDALVNQLLTLTKIENKPSLSKTNVINVPVLLNQLKQEAETLSSHQHNICLTLDKNCGVVGEEEQLRSAFSNLVFNAVRYTPEGGSIDIRWQKRDDGCYSFSVQDTGDGIAAEHIPRLTERFYRVDQARTRDNGGSGLGLSIVKQILAHYDTSLVIHSELKKGSTFSFVLDKKHLTTL